ncbi:hypothetical protein [Neomegalonema sp.]|uniref:hypothetical protein n=1 Tax=Neomegalonema sp. TaxID=2039713 RepID=UPI00262702FF|nr:hypothetical protein [Neomegalonema sp.]MDD2868733.1 hypothetical protein [Neomegalonema sp.]
MRFSFRFLTLLLLGPLASFAPPAERAEAASAPLEESREESLRLRAALEPALPGGVGGGWMAAARVEILDAWQAPRLVHERRLTLADFDAEGGFALEIPHNAPAGARHRLTLRVLSAEGRTLWTAAAVWETEAQKIGVRDLGRLTLKRA